MSADESSPFKTERLSCWGWYVGMPAERVDVGAHDCGRSDHVLQETVTASNSSRVADGKIHNVALVVKANEV